MTSIIIFVQIHDFFKLHEERIKRYLLLNKKVKRKRKSALHITEIATIIILFHYSGFKTFKEYYKKLVMHEMKGDFPCLVSYNRFIEIQNEAMMFLWLFIETKKNPLKSKEHYIDSFAIKSSHIKRAYSHKSLRAISKKGKTSIGWFYGIKLHLIINIYDDIENFALTPGNVSDNNSSLIQNLCNNLNGKVFGDRGYLLSQYTKKKLQEKSIKFITKKRSNMKLRQKLSSEDEALLKKRGIIESVGNILKSCLSLEHTRHRSITGFFTHIFSTLTAYIFRDKHPSIANFAKIP